MGYQKLPKELPHPLTHRALGSPTQSNKARPQHGRFLGDPGAVASPKSTKSLSKTGSGLSKFIKICGKVCGRKRKTNTHNFQWSKCLNFTHASSEYKHQKGGFYISASSWVLRIYASALKTLQAWLAHGARHWHAPQGAAAGVDCGTARQKGGAKARVVGTVLIC